LKRGGTYLILNSSNPAAQPAPETEHTMNTNTLPPKPILTFEKIAAHSFHHAVGDPAKPAAYRVLLNGESLGEVYTRSTESWRKHGRIRTGFRGYSRYWVAVPLTGKEDRFNYSRAAAVEFLTTRK